MACHHWVVTNGGCYCCVDGTTEERLDSMPIFSVTCYQLAELHQNLLYIISCIKCAQPIFPKHKTKQQAVHSPLQCLFLFSLYFTRQVIFICNSIAVCYPKTLFNYPS